MSAQSRPSRDPARPPGAGAGAGAEADVTAGAELSAGARSDTTAGAGSGPDPAGAPGQRPGQNPGYGPAHAEAPEPGQGPVQTPGHGPGPAPKYPAAPLTVRQEARRDRILAASTQLACGGGFEAVQMRAVAERSEVALGTLYRYFPSKIHLLVAVMEDQLRQLHEALRARPPAAEQPGERVAEVLLRAFRALQREPRLADAMVRALIFADRSVRSEVDTVSRLTTRIIVDAMGTAGAPGPAGACGTTGAPDASAGTRADLPGVRVIEHTWHAALVSWLSGRESVAQVTTDIRTACALLDRPAG